MKPDWKDAPEWAKWLAMDEDSKWFWYERKPSLLLSFWNTAGMFELASEPDWENSLEARPDDTLNT